MTELSRHMFAAIQNALAVNPEVTAEELAAEFGTLSADQDAIADALLTASIQMADQEGGEFTSDDVRRSTDAIIAEARAKQMGE